MNWKKLKGFVSLHKEHVLEMVIPSDPVQIHKVEMETDKLAKKLGLKEDDRDNLGIAVTEVVANAIIHGNKKNKHKKVFIKFIYSDKFIRIHIRDEGQGFIPDDIANPVEPENIFKDSGRGIFIVKTLMDDVKYQFHDHGSEVILYKVLHNL
ncbi:MAG TPA: ATP-binding protein [bacterium]|nr:ATP-binding protein [bacterium]HPN45767.1 ATP-binding protein [bacterium]